MKKGKSKPMPDNNWTEENWMHVNWCIKNKIIISPIMKRGQYKVGIALYDHNNVNLSKDTFDADEVWEVVANYSKYYYEKYSKET